MAPIAGSHRVVDESLQLHGRFRRSGRRHDLVRLRSVRDSWQRAPEPTNWQQHAPASQALLPASCCTIFRPRRYFWATLDQYHSASSQQSWAIAGWQQQVWPLWFPVLAFSPFIVDATVTLVRRALAGKKVWEAHREHLYQRMVTTRLGTRADGSCVVRADGSGRGLCHRCRKLANRVANRRF